MKRNEGTPVFSGEHGDERLPGVFPAREALGLREAKAAGPWGGGGVCGDRRDWR